MPHPDGGRGNYFSTKHTFDDTYNYVAKGDISFRSTTGEEIFAKVGFTQDKKYKTIVFYGENSRHGNVCSKCWGYRENCQGARIGQCVEALDNNTY